MKPSLHLARLRDLALVAVSALVVLLPISPLVMPLANRDSGVFLYMGWRILHGEIPYLHVWDHKPPVIFYINALGLALAGGSDWGVWLLELAALVLAATLGYRLVRRAFGVEAAVVSLALWLASLILVIQGGNRTTEFALPLQFACLWLAADVHAPRHDVRRAAAIGLLCALLFWTKQNAVGVGIAVALYLVIDRTRTGQWGRLGRELAALAAGFAAVSAAVVAYFALQGALPQLWSAAFVYNFAYVAGNLDAFLRNLVDPAKYLVVTGLLPLALIGYGAAVWGWLSRAAFFRDQRALLSVCLIWLPVEFLLFNLSGRAYLHYAMTLLPVLAVFAGLGYWAISQRLRSWRPRTAWIVVAAIGLLALTAAVRYHFSRDAIAYAKAGERVAASIQESTTPADTVLVWGAESSVNFFAQRGSPSRFVYQFPLYHPGYASEALILEFLDAIVQARPAMIIDTGNPATPLFDFPIDTPAIRERVAAIRSLYGSGSPLAGGTLYRPDASPPGLR